MGVDLPPSLQFALALTGTRWPEADETVLFERGQSWRRLSETAVAQRTAANDSVNRMLAENSSDGLTRFAGYWERLGGSEGHLRRSMKACAIMGGACFAGASIVLTLKLAMIVQLGALALELTAYALLVPTRGASARFLPAVREVRMTIQKAIRGAIDAVKALGPLLAGIASDLLVAEIDLLNSRPIHHGPDRRDVAEADAERNARLQERQRRYAELAKDPSHGGAAGSQSQREAEIGLDAEEAGLLRGPIVRDPTGSAEFIDANGQKWDVKGFKTWLDGRRGTYSDQDATTKIERELDRDQKVILDLSGLQEPDLSSLKNLVCSRPGWAGRVVIW